MFIDRQEAGELLAEALKESLGDVAGDDIVVLGIPRGGVEVAAVVADALGAPLDVVIPRKVGAPGNPELGLGAVAENVEVVPTGRLASSSRRSSTRRWASATAIAGTVSASLSQERRYALTGDAKPFGDFLHSHSLAI